MEGEVVPVHWICTHGWRVGWQRGTLIQFSILLFFDQLMSHQTVLVLKYILNGYPEQFTYYGYANVSQSVALMLSAIVLWIAQSGSSEYEYNLTL